MADGRISAVIFEEINIETYISKSSQTGWTPRKSLNVRSLKLAEPKCKTVLQNFGLATNRSTSLRKIRNFLLIFEHDSVTTMLALHG